MSKKWFGIAFVGAMGAGMVANFAYQNVVMGQVSAGTEVREDEPEVPGQEPGAAVVDVIAPAAGKLPNLQGPGALRRTIEVVNGQNGLSRYEVSSGTPTFFGSPPDMANVYAIQNQANTEIRASEFEVAKLLKEFQSAEEENKGKIVEKIAAEVKKQFELRQADREKELKELEKQLAKLKEKHEKRESMKDKIVEDRVNQLVDNLEGLGWGTEPVPFGGVGALPAEAFAPGAGWMAPATRLPFGVNTTSPSALAPGLPAAPAAPSAPARVLENRSEYRTQSGSKND
jgi:hypothetical protein